MVAMRAVEPRSPRSDTGLGPGGKTGDRAAPSSAPQRGRLLFHGVAVGSKGAGNPEFLQGLKDHWPRTPAPARRRARWRASTTRAAGSPR